MINKSIAKIEDNQFGGKNVFYKTRFFLVKSTFAKRFSSKCIFLLCSVRHRTRAVLRILISHMIQILMSIEITKDSTETRG